MNKLKSKSGKLSRSSPAPPCGSVLHHRPWIMWVSKMQLLFRTFKTWRRFFSFWTCGPFPGWWLGWHPSASGRSLGTWAQMGASSNTENQGVLTLYQSSQSLWYAKSKNIPGKPACHQGSSLPSSCCSWYCKTTSCDRWYAGPSWADWSLKRRSKNEPRCHRGQATTALERNFWDLSNM